MTGTSFAHDEQMIVVETHQAELRAEARDELLLRQRAAATAAAAAAAAARIAAARGIAGEGVAARRALPRGNGRRFVPLGPTAAFGDLGC
jgi:hypothetical protein